MMNCRLCNASISQGFALAEIHNRTVSYYECPVCCYVQTENPTWLDEAYASPINKSDTGIMARNQANVGLVLATLSILNRPNGCVVDCAGGYGILVRLLRDCGVDAFWSDPFCKNLLAVGFEYTKQTPDLVTAFEAFEHFVDPLGEAEKLLAIAPNLLISTELIATPAPAVKEWWYYGLDHGQHIGFFSLKALQFMANKFGKHLITDGIGFHLFTDIPINSFKWNLNVRIARKFPNFYRRKLRSKTWSDFEIMRGKC